MTTAERINKSLQHLPGSYHQEVLDFVEFLFQKNEKGKNGRENISALKKADAIELWAKRHRFQTAVILDDRREIIYED